MRPFNNMGMSPMEKELRQHQMFFSEMRELDDYKNCINRVVREYTEMIDTKISSHDLKIKTATEIMVDNIIHTTTELINKLAEEGKFTVNLTYDPNSESLALTANVVITNFYFEDHSVVFTEGMTWREFVSSPYNVDGHFTELNGAILYDSNKMIAHLTSFDNPSSYNIVHPNDQIKNKAIYVAV